MHCPDPTKARMSDAETNRIKHVNHYFTTSILSENEGSSRLTSKVQHKDHDILIVSNTSAKSGGSNDLCRESPDKEACLR